MSPYLGHSQLKIRNFHQPFVRHRTRSGGGVAMYFNPALAATRLPGLEMFDEEWIWSKVRYINVTLIICCVYLPPNLKAERLDTFLYHYSETVNMAYKYNPTSIVTIGDFNAGNSYFQILGATKRSLFSFMVIYLICAVCS